MLEKTITSNNKVRLNPQYPIVAGVDSDNVPRLVRTTVDGRLDLGGVVLPEFDNFAVAYYGSTNNIHTVIYTFEGNEVGRWTFTYSGGGAANNDLVTVGAFTTP